MCVTSVDCSVAAPLSLSLSLSLSLQAVSVSLSVCLCLFLCVLSLSVSVSVSLSLSGSLSLWKLSLSVCLSVCLSLSLSLSLSLATCDGCFAGQSPTNLHGVISALHGSGMTRLHGQYIGPQEFSKAGICRPLNTFGQSGFNSHSAFHFLQQARSVTESVGMMAGVVRL